MQAENTKSSLNLLDFKSQETTWHYLRHYAYMYAKMHANEENKM